MNYIRYLMVLLIAVMLSLVALRVQAAVLVQCPGDTNGDAVIDTPDPAHPNAKCMHLSAGDGFVTMADGKLQYMFGFGNLTGIMPDMAMMEGMLAGSWPAPTIELDEGDEFYLTITNVGMMMRPDLFDPHSVHWHGFPNAAPIFDGMPDSTITINMGASQSYYYNVVQPGTYFYHCHVEATEHMQMGMLGNLYVRPAQDGTSIGGFTTFAYNDGDGSTGYDVDYPIQLGGFDPDFHDASMNIQPLPFALMRDRYLMINGRGYPDTVNVGSLTPPMENMGKVSQSVSSLITASAGQRILLRLSNVNVTRCDTLISPSIPMLVVGEDARLLRGPTGNDLYYTTNSVTMCGGESLDVILDTAGVAAGTYFLHTANLNYLSNDQEDFGGQMTEIVITP